jgi:hypothetical protein
LSVSKYEFSGHVINLVPDHKVAADFVKLFNLDIVICYFLFMLFLQLVKFVNLGDFIWEPWTFNLLAFSVVLIVVRVTYDFVLFFNFFYFI